MMPLARYEPLGAFPHYYAGDGSAHGATIAELLPQLPTNDWDLDGVRTYLDRAPDGTRTCFEGIRAVGPGMELIADGSLRTVTTQKDTRPPVTLPVALERAVRAIVADSRRTAVALSGGLDSALLVAMLRAIGRDDVPVFTLVTGLPGYCELAETGAAAGALGVRELHVIDAPSLIDTLPSAIAAAEVPLFNLHPVSRWVLASELRREGFEVLLTGDGADQVFAGSDPRNYLPIVGALTRAAGLELRSPFFDPLVVASAPPPSRDKTALREAAATWLPPEIVHRPKTPRLAPPLDVSQHWNSDAIASLATQLGMPQPARSAGPETTLWTTLGILARFFD